METTLTTNSVDLTTITPMTTVTDNRLCENAPELARALDALMHRYVELVDGAEHGGWTLADEKAVQEVQSALRKSGFSHAALHIR